MDIITTLNPAIHVALFSFAVVTTHLTYPPPYQWKSNENTHTWNLMKYYNTINIMKTSWSIVTWSFYTYDISLDFNVYAFLFFSWIIHDASFIGATYENFTIHRFWGKFQNFYGQNNIPSITIFKIFLFICDCLPVFWEILLWKFNLRKPALPWYWPCLLSIIILCYL